MPPGPALKRTADRDGAAADIEVRPLEPDRLALAEAECQRESEPDAVSSLAGRCQDALCFLKRQRLDLGLYQLRCPRNDRRIVDDVATA